jgi:hypothetical protein
MSRLTQRLRLAVLLLLLLNLSYYFWSEGMLRGAGLGPTVQTEPQRLARQIKPDAVQLRKPEAVMPDSAASAASASASTAGPAGECLEAGPFDEAQSVALRRAASDVLPASAWTLVPALTPARWIVYIGQYSSPATIESKRAELAALKISVEPLTNPELELGLSLGHFETRAAAAAALEALKKRGLRKALVVQEQPELPGVVLRVRLSNGLARAQLSGLTPALAGKDWLPCR